MDWVQEVQLVRDDSCYVAYARVASRSSSRASGAKTQPTKLAHTPSCASASPTMPTSSARWTLRRRASSRTSAPRPTRPAAHPTPRADLSLPRQQPARRARHPTRLRPPGHPAHRPQRRASRRRPRAPTTRCTCATCRRYGRSPTKPTRYRPLRRSHRTASAARRRTRLVCGSARRR